MNANQVTPPPQWKPPSKTEAEKLRPKGLDDQRQLALLPECAPVPKPRKKRRGK